MFAVLAVLFLVVPFLELFVLLQVGQAIGALPTVAVLVGVSVAGAWLCKREGLGVLRRARADLRSGHVPARAVVDGAMILLAGALLVTPGFVTDLVGLVLLVPPARSLLQGAVLAWLGRSALSVRPGTRHPRR